MTTCSHEFEFRMEIGRKLRALPDGELTLRAKVTRGKKQYEVFVKESDYSENNLFNVIAIYTEFVLQGIEEIDFKSKAELFVWARKSGKSSFYQTYSLKNSFLLDAYGQEIPAKHPVRRGWLGDFIAYSAA